MYNKQNLLNDIKALAYIAGAMITGILILSILGI